MIITHNQQAPGGNSAPESARTSPPGESKQIEMSINELMLPAALQMNFPIATHDPQAGLNPMVDAAAYLFTIMGQISTTENFFHFEKLQGELLREIEAFEINIKALNYNEEYIQVSRYVLCAVIDSMISNTKWGRKDWEAFSLLSAYDLDKDHQEKFFSILEHAVKDPANYIDLMELMYICLSIGYSGDYHGNDHERAQLDQITDSLYKYIRVYRGNVSKLLSPAPLKTPRATVTHSAPASTSPLTILLFTACVITTLFIGLGYLMEMISNEAITNFADVQKTVARSSH